MSSWRTATATAGVTGALAAVSFGGGSGVLGFTTAAATAAAAASGVLFFQ